jgi:predicted DCC family thiol-disulfide oxidoreductase YuxK
LNKDDKIILLFDGICNLCNSSVNFVLDHDKHDRFRFASLQSETAKKILAGTGMGDTPLDSAALIENGKVYLRSDVALRAAWHLGGGWALFYAFAIVPRFMRDWIYNWIAKNRYSWFGKRESCRMPDAQTRAKFLE